MNKAFTCILLCLSTLGSFAQNVGVGVANPVEKLDVAGGIKLGNTSNTAAGTIRWNEVRSDFEGYNGKVWVSLTGGKGAWGNQQSFATENAASQLSLTHGTGTLLGTNLGYSMGISGNLLVAGASGNHGSSSGPNFTGSLHVFYYDGSKWIAKTPLTSFSPIAGERLGTSVAISGHNIIGGAPYANLGNGNYQGRAMIFPYDPVTNTYSSPAILTASDALAGDMFGTSVAINSNFALVGAPSRDVNGNNNIGRCYFYKRNGSSWSQHSIILPPAAVTDDYFGFAVSMTEEWAAIASPYTDVNGTINAGKVYLYKYNSGTDSWNIVTSLVPQTTRTMERFGSSIHITNDILAVGSDRYVGNPMYDSTGEVAIYRRNGDSWNLEATVSASDGNATDAFGSSVHVSGNKVIVGAMYGDAGSNIDQGKSYIFQHNGTGWVEEAIIVASQSENNANFGKSVLIHPHSALVGAPNADLGTLTDNGRIFFYYK